MVRDHYLIDNKLNAKPLSGYLNRSSVWEDRLLNAAPWKGSVEGASGQEQLALHSRCVVQLDPGIGDAEESVPGKNADVGSGIDLVGEHRQ